MTNRLIFQINAIKRAYSPTLKINIGDELKIIKGKDISKKGCAILDKNDEFIDFIPSPERFEVWDRLELDKSLTTYATVIGQSSDRASIMPWGEIVTSPKCIPFNSDAPIWSIKIQIEFRLFNEDNNDDFYPVSLVGFKYLDKLPELKELDNVEVMHEAQNSHDKLALKVVNESNVKIGYIPMNFHAREDLISRLMAKEKVNGFIYDIKIKDSLIKTILLYIAK